MAVVLPAFIFASCSKSDKTAPVPPAAESLAVDFSAFNSAATKALSSDDLESFYEFVSTNVLANWVNIFDGIINIPVEAYKQLLISSAPVQDGKGWTWTAAYTDALEQVYTVELYGEEAGNNVNWEVRVSKDGLLGYEDFAWVTGWSAKDGSNGQWNVKVNPLDTDVLVTLDWTASAGKVDTVKITYDLEHLLGDIATFFNDSYIVYSTSATDDAYDHSITAYYNQMGLGFWQVDIEWNSKSGAGRVCSKNQYGDSEWHCWNPAHEDIEE